jgi:hypothetical protein
MRLLTASLLLLTACSGGKLEDDDDEVGLVKPDIDTDEPDDTDTDTDTDTDDTDTDEPVDTADEPDPHGEIALSDALLKFTEAGSVSVSISNTGDAALSLSGFTLDGEGEEAFSLGSPGTSTLAPDSSTSFSVTFTPPLESGGWRAEITVASSDPDSGEVIIEVVGGIGEPKLDFDEDPLEISGAIIGCERIGTAVLRNDGGGFIEITGLSMSGSAEMSLGKSDSLPMSLLSGETAEVEVSYLPMDEYDDTAYLLVATDDVPGTLTITGSAEVYDEGAEFFELDKPTMSFALSDTPVESTIVVRVDGVDQSGKFSYDAKENAVVFDSGSVPTAGAVVEIEYAIAGGC